MPADRPYQSPLREAQANMTRERIVMAAREYLEHNSINDLSLRQIASLSGVSPPTVYAHFPTMDDLLGTFFLWLKPRVGFDKPLPSLEELPLMPERVFPLYEQHGVLLRNLMNQPSWDRQRFADRDNRLDRWIASIGGELPGFDTGTIAPRGIGDRLVLDTDALALADGCLSLHCQGSAKRRFFRHPRLDPSFEDRRRRP